ncbi:3'-5' exoribonuclease YhaM family protein [Syntrophothermus lipocalidus]|uniref:Metal dependent phosphohydrolase n=1 Tax=Syntrophothermus lipocalidus (strain DSM 12680 / TGB-C1) TaxID=643648 RepID=D7CIK8_SYNLT|nr:HD domain-containing protein [Syntrophothermus lipocalidus]ADI00873.1 metal dependent phosphohydrolase [Syntrophothermus lipocalidus DSM 12680]
MPFRALIKSRTQGISAKGNPYISMQLAVKPGAVPEMGQARHIKANRWTAGEDDISNLVPGRWINVNRYTVTENERYETSLSIWEYEVTDPPEDPERYVETSKRPADELWEDLLSLVQRINDGDLKNMVRALLDENREAFCRTPAAKQYHHAYVGGLVEHTLEVVRIALASAEAMNENGVVVDTDVLLAGAVLHDIGKTKEYEIDRYGVITINESVKLKGDHCLLGRDMLYRFWENDWPLKWKVSESRIDAIAHLILSHHGQLEWRAIVEPATTEAVILHLADMISSKANGIDRAIKSARENGVAGRFRLYDRSIYPWVGTEQSEREMWPEESSDSEEW